VQQGLVLFVGLYGGRLLAKLDDLVLLALDVRLVLTTGDLVGLNGRLGLFDAIFGVCQLGFDRGMALGKGSDLGGKTSDLLVYLLQFEKMR
jgi:hypothetical protein